MIEMYSLETVADMLGEPCKNYTPPNKRRYVRSKIVEHKVSHVVFGKREWRLTELQFQELVEKMTCSGSSRSKTQPNGISGELSADREYTRVLNSLKKPSPRITATGGKPRSRKPMPQELERA